MNEEKRINGGYEIIESCTIGSNELVIGHNPKAPNPYVCWYCKGLHDAKRFREQYTKIGSLAEAFAAAEAYFDGLEKDITEEER